ncbi:MAG TPA: MFS transporter [Ktedonobacteraceae bacterium]|nr:MFS transporter [Ktedonobacteraceae bacterium]
MAVATPRGEGFLTLLRKRNFLLLWLAQLISMTVLSASNFALIILISDVNGSTTLIGLALIAFSVPAVLFGAPAGVFVDRRNKKQVLFYSNCLRAVATFCFVISLLINHTQLVPAYLLTFLISGIGQFFTPAEGASIPMLVSEDELMHALSLFQVTFMLSNALGLIILGPLILNFLPTVYVLGMTVLPVISLYFIMALLYLVCAGLIALIPSRNFVEPKRPKAATGVLAAESLGVLQTIWHEMFQAWTFIRRRPMLFEAVVQLSFAGVLLQLIGQLAVPLVRDLLNMRPALMPVVFAPAGIGLVLSSLFMPRIIKALNISRTIFIGCMALASMIILLPLSTLLTQQMKQSGTQIDVLQVVVVDVIMFLAGVAINFVNIPSSTSMQEKTPEWIKGRVLALQLVLYNACSIPSVLLIGWLTDRFKLPVALYSLAFCIILFGFWGFFYEHKPHPREHEEEKNAQAQEEPETISKL